MLSQLEKLPFQSILAGERLTLTGVESSMAPLLWESIQRDRKYRNDNWVWLESLVHLESYLSKASHNPPADEFVYLMNFEQKVIGTIHIHTLNYLDYKTEVGYWIEKSFEGKGLVSEALQLVESELKRLGFNKVVINCNIKNMKSIKVAERNGYQREGTLLCDCVENGAFRDSALFGKIISMKT